MTPQNVQSTGMKLRCIATAHSGLSQRKTAPEHPLRQAGFFKSAQWSADGTSILTHNEDNSLRTFVLPPDLLSLNTHHDLTSYTAIPAPEPVYSTTLYPHFNLSDPSTTLLLSSTRDHPIRLHNVLDTSASHPPITATYPLIDTQTEAYLTPHSMLIPPQTPHTFVAGTTSRLSIFDLSRPGEGPVQSVPTIPSKRKKIVGGGVGMKGIISALDVSRDGLLAAGTLSRWVGLYDSSGAGKCVGVFPLFSTATGDGVGGEEQNLLGTGITSVHFSPDGTYLHVGERMSDVILVYDIRVQGRALGWLKGRKAVTNQRMGFEVVPGVSDSDAGHDIWAGGTDGCVRIWRDPHRREGMVAPDEEWRAHDDVVSSVGVHPTCSVVMTCSGSRQPRQVFCPRHASKTEHKALLVSSDDGSDGSTDNDMMEDSATESTPSDASIETSGVLDREGNLTEEKPVEYSLKIWSL